MFPLNKNTTDGTDKFVTTYYVRDPQGNVLAVYEHKHGDSGDGTFTLTEQHLYGASRLGMTKPNLVLSGTGTGSADPTAPAVHYELTNHLGNVLAVITPDASDATQPAIESLTDYYPFGMTEPGRSYTRPGDDYRFGHTGHEKENELAEGVYITEYRLLNTRLGRWLSVDPLAGKYLEMSPYNYCAGNPLVFWDPDGKEVISSFDYTGTHDKRKDEKTGDWANLFFRDFFKDYPDVAPRIIVLSMHGSQHSMTTEFGISLKTPKDVKNFLEENSSVYDDNNPRRKDVWRECVKPSVLVLLSCGTANNENGEGCIAQEISMTKEIPLVIAPDKSLMCYMTNDHHSEVFKENERKPNEPGCWVVYYKGVVVDRISGGTWFGGLLGKANQILDILRENKDPDKLIDKYQKKYDEIKKNPPTKMDLGEVDFDTTDLTD